ncbi:hypothetical protein TWF481_003513 [Arthrobotrys musiformis]|uniref:Uncharacterized protein n=1 Tax=Arthrobotrys musiformis TaxID=47236 RepID=A0AAV9VP19_9PEZI
MTSGILTETLDGISEEVLQTISSKLKDESFRFSTSKRIEIPKPNGALTAGYMEFRQHKNNIIGTPQGSIEIKPQELKSAVITNITSPKQ